ncbi:DNA replication/repair protein RecF [Candidatus Dojkabacteria bacterium]|nr:DNA replication/repair protein RecF [Candidatus Dojkabacteria bacterium]
MRINRLKLENFRQFRNKTVEFGKNWTVIVAPNASGKSSIIEAIYMLSYGDSPWTNKTSNLIKITHKTEEIQNKPGKINDKLMKTPEVKDYEKLINHTCRISSEIERNQEIKNLSMVIQNNNRSIVKSFKEDTSSITRKEFIQNIHTILFSPDMIDYLMFEPKQRRDFLDKHIESIDPEYGDILNNYEKVLRQRNSLLRIIRSKTRQRLNGYKNGYSNGYYNHYSNSNNNTSTYQNLKSQQFSDESSLKYWTEQLINLGSIVMTKRFDFVNRLNGTKQDLYPTKINYIPKLILNELETLGNTSYIEQEFKKQIQGIHEKEKVVGITLIGPHRDDWSLENKGININELGSRGEKRLSISDVILKVNHIIKEDQNIRPIILLDDISSELDEKNMKELFQNKISKDQQAIITTTTEAHLPDKVIENSQIIHLNDDKSED